MVTQTTFDFEPIARTTDPATSQIAAREIAPSLSGYRAMFVERLRELGEATANEVSGGNESIRKRARECQRLGLIVEAGTRACRNTGKQATVWKVSQ